jgi:hypothetical protein
VSNKCTEGEVLVLMLQRFTHPVDGFDYSADVMDWIVTQDSDCTSDPKAKKYYQYVKYGRSLKIDMQVRYANIPCPHFSCVQIFTTSHSSRSIIHIIKSIPTLLIITMRVGNGLRLVSSNY